MKKTIRFAIVFAAMAALGLAQDKPADAPKGPVAKDAEEAKLINTVNAEPDPAKRLTELDEWKQKYPDTQFGDARQTFYLLTYEQLKKNRESFDKAKEILAKHPDDYLALQAIVTFGPTLNNNNPSKEDFDTIIQTANYMLDNADKVFAPSNKPATITAADWPKVKPYWMQQLPRLEAQMWVNTKNYPQAEQEIGKILAKHPNDPAIDQMMGQVVLNQQKDNPDKGALALFYYARAACYDGDGALPAQARTQVRGFLTRAYNTYHGSADGMDQLCATAKANPAPPADFKVLSVAEIADAKAKQEAAEAAANPAMALWKKVKEGVTGSDPAFVDSVKGAGLPSTDGSMKWKGKLVLMKPAIRPKTLVLAVENPAGDVTLNFEMPLPGKMEPGAELEFWGEVSDVQKDPYMLTMKVDKENLTGWKPVAPAGRKSTSSKKGQ